MVRKPVILSCANNTPGKPDGRKLLLEGDGYQVLTAANRREAVQALVSNPVDLILLDCNRMPQRDGDVAALQMKACKPDVPIALLSEDERVPPSALEAVDAFIPKSEPVKEFLEKVDYLVSLRLLFQPLDGSWADEAPAKLLPLAFIKSNKAVSATFRRRS